jgi:hypothetical protein
LFETAIDRSGTVEYRMQERYTSLSAFEFKH